MNVRNVSGALVGIFLGVVAACDSGSDSATVDAAAGTTTDIDASSGSGSGSGSDGTVSEVDCSAATTQMEKAVCQASGFLDTLTTTQRATANPAFTDTVARTKWSNLPGQARAGVQMGSISASSQAAALALMGTVLSSEGMDDLNGVRAADAYLGTVGGGNGYSANNYYVAVFGTPSTTGDWAVTFGGHHMAYNITFTNGVGYPVPNHLGAEPKASFTVNNVSYQPLVGEGAALVALYNSFDSTVLANAYLSGQTFSDVLIGPVEYGTGSSALAKAKFPTGTNRNGVLVSSLTAEQQDLVTAAIAQWVSDYDPMIATSLLADYTSSTAYADTYVAWGGSQASGVNVDVNGTYMRIDGPRVWIEVACQNGVVIQGSTHYHTIYRDKTFDYANTL